MEKNTHSNIKYVIGIIIFIIVLLVSIFTVLYVLTYDKFEYRVYDDHVELISYKYNNTKVEIPNQFKGLPVTKIGYSAFSFKTNLESIIIPDTVQTIGQRAFAYCTKLKNIEGGKGIYSIEEGAFYNTSVSKLSFSSALHNIESGAFLGLPRLEEIEISSDNENYSIIDGVMYSKDLERLLCYPSQKKGSTFTVPDGVICIDAAFSNANYLQEIYLADSVKVIGYGAFMDCKELDYISIPSTITAIGDYAFMNTPWLKNKNMEFVTLNDKFLLAYNGDSSVLRVPEGITSLSIQDSNQLQNINSIEIPSSLIEITEGFLEIPVSEYNVSKENSYFYDENGILFNKDMSKLYRYTYQNINKYTVPDSVITIGKYAFKDCSIKEIIVPNGVVEIGDKAFMGCTKLENIWLPNTVTKMGIDIFNDCKNVTINGESCSTSEQYASYYDIRFNNIGN